MPLALCYIPTKRKRARPLQPANLIVVIEKHVQFPSSAALVNITHTIL